MVRSMGASSGRSFGWCGVVLSMIPVSTWSPTRSSNFSSFRSASRGQTCSRGTQSKVDATSAALSRSPSSPRSLQASRIVTTECVMLRSPSVNPTAPTPDGRDSTFGTKLRKYPMNISNVRSPVCIRTTSMLYPK